VGILISPRAKDGVCPQSKRQSVRQSIRGGGPGNPPSFSLLAENFKLLCKFPAATVSDVFGVPKWRVWREQKRQANAIIQVAAAISCLISIINTRHRQRATGNWKPASRAKSIQTRPGTRRSHKARGADTSNNWTMGTNHFICQTCGRWLDGCSSSRGKNKEWLTSVCARL